MKIAQRVSLIAAAIFAVSPVLAQNGGAGGADTATAGATGTIGGVSLPVVAATVAAAVVIVSSQTSTTTTTN